MSGNISPELQRSAPPNALSMGANRPPVNQDLAPFIAQMFGRATQQPAQQPMQQPMRQPMRQPMPQQMPQMTQPMQQQGGYNPFAAIAQMQRQPMQQPVINPIFGGAIPMNFGLPQASQIPSDFTSRLSSFKPGTTPINTPEAVVKSLFNQSGDGYTFNNWSGGNQNE